MLFILRIRKTVIFSSANFAIRIRFLPQSTLRLEKTQRAQMGKYVLSPWSSIRYRSNTNARIRLIIQLIAKVRNFAVFYF